MKCRYCQFEQAPKCNCLRCSSIRACWYCSELHHHYFREELDFEKQKLA